MYCSRKHWTLEFGSILSTAWKLNKFKTKHYWTERANICLHQQHQLLKVTVLCGSHQLFDAKATNWEHCISDNKIWTSYLMCLSTPNGCCICDGGAFKKCKFLPAALRSSKFGLKYKNMHSPALSQFKGVTISCKSHAIHRLRFLLQL